MEDLSRCRSCPDDTDPSSKLHHNPQPSEVKKYITQINNNLDELSDKIAEAKEKLGIQAVMQEVLLETDSPVSDEELLHHAQQVGYLKGLFDAFNTVKYKSKFDKT